LSAPAGGRTLPCVDIGILGCGNVSDRYFEGLAKHEFLTVVACADLDRDRAEDKAAQHGIACVRAPDELMADPEVELVVNLTPPQAHAAATMDAVRSGKHVWSEKPLAASLADAPSS
jgi:predicted dehydrogenase